MRIFKDLSYDELYAAFAGKQAAIDIETTGLDKGSQIISVGVCIGDDVYYLKNNFEVLKYIECPIFHNANFDTKHLNWECQISFNSFRDTLTMWHLIDENVSNSLGDLVLRHFQNAYKAEFKAKFKVPGDADEESLLKYNCEDVYYTYKLYQKGLKILEERNQLDLYEEVLRTQYHLIKTEIRGLRVDVDFLINKGAELHQNSIALEKEMQSLVAQEIEYLRLKYWNKELDKYKTEKKKKELQKPEFKFTSNAHLKDLLYDVLGLPEQTNEKTKNVSVDYDSLENIKEAHPLIPKIQEFRELEKIYGTYFKGILERMDTTFKVYPSFNVSGTATGRLSHSNPNMANLPRSGGVRGIFIPEPGHMFISADFSQLEVRIAAHFTQDKNLLRIINEGISQHDITAQGLGIERNLAKSVNFAMQYGASAFKIAKLLKCSAKRSQEVYDKYWETYAGQRDLMKICNDKVDAGECIRTPHGRERHFEKRKRAAWDKAYRQSWNALVQGTGSDLCSRSFSSICEFLEEKGMGYGLFTVHDEILISVKIEHVKEAEEKLLEIMSTIGNGINLTVPLMAESSGPMVRWED